MKTERNSSFELLRIILILLILIEHGNMWFIGSAYQSNAEHIAKCIVESICIGSVNAFILISGWFGIKSGINKIGRLVFVLLFTTLPVIIVTLSLGLLSLNSINSIETFYQYVLGGDSYWFVAAYIGLAVMSPILNYAVIHLPHAQFKHILIVGYGLMLLYDFALKTTVLGIEGGYSSAWFVYLYLLAAYMRCYGITIIDNHSFAILVAAIAIQSWLFTNGYIGLRYTNPLILIEALCLIRIFSRYNFYNKYINYAASGCLMAYLIHMQPVCLPYIRRFLIMEYKRLSYGGYMAEIIVLSIIVFLFAIFLNKIQFIIYDKLSTTLQRKKYKQN